MMWVNAVPTLNSIDTSGEKCCPASERIAPPNHPKAWLSPLALPSRFPFAWNREKVPAPMFLLIVPTDVTGYRWYCRLAQELNRVPTACRFALEP